MARPGGVRAAVVRDLTQPVPWTWWTTRPTAGGGAVMVETIPRWRADLLVADAVPAWAWTAGLAVGAGVVVWLLRRHL